MASSARRTQVECSGTDAEPRSADCSGLTWKAAVSTRHLRARLLRLPYVTYDLDPLPGDDVTGNNPRRYAWVAFDGWSGRWRVRVEVIGETPKCYRVRTIERTKWAGRSRWREGGTQTLVPKAAVKLDE